ELPPEPVGVPETWQTTSLFEGTVPGCIQAAPSSVHWPATTPGGRPEALQVACPALAAPLFLQEKLPV
ncbi:hypothetical protein, partial [Bacillus cereus group sp. Bce020]|uniref:hypothetical protein n=1 Tax=Bacillus cereus group sp. Bce020 TaxID=3445246 RepID=UPI003F2209CE